MNGSSRMLCALLAAAPTLCAHPANAGKLDRIGRETRGGDEPARTSSSSTSSSTDERSYSGGDGLGAVILFYIVTSPWTVPHLIVENARPRGASGRARFGRHPYAGGELGHLVEAEAPEPAGSDDLFTVEQPPRDPSPEPSPAAKGKAFAVQLSLDTGLDLGGVIWRHGGALRLQFPHRLEVDADWSRFQEYTRQGRDQLTLGREHLALRFAESRRVQFRTGVGARHLVDAEGWVHGVDFSYGFDAFPARPVVLSLEASLGSLGGAFAGGFRGSLGVLAGPIELSAGWDYRAIGGVTLSGPLLMLRGWF